MRMHKISSIPLITISELQKKTNNESRKRTCISHEKIRIIIRRVGVAFIIDVCEMSLVIEPKCKKKLTKNYEQYAQRRNGINKNQ